MKKFLCAFRRCSHRLCLCICLTLLAGCGASKPVPEWLNTSHHQLEGYKKSYLTGNEKVAASQYKGVLTEIKKTGDLQLLGKVYLTRMALQTAVLEDPADNEYRKLDEVSLDPQNRNFYTFLKGEMTQVDENLLPRQYRGIYAKMRQGKEADRLKEITKIQDPLSQLIAIGILMRLRQDDEALMNQAIATASHEGWKKAVLIYLERLKLFYEGKQEMKKALAIEQRINLIRD